MSAELFGESGFSLGGVGNAPLHGTTTSDRRAHPSLSLPGCLTKGEQPGGSDWLAGTANKPVSYTHLTLPTIYSV